MKIIVIKMKTNKKKINVRNLFLIFKVINNFSKGNTKNFLLGSKKLCKSMEAWFLQQIKKKQNNCMKKEC